MLLYLIADRAAWGEYKKPVTAEEAAAGRSAWWGNGREKKKKKWDPRGRKVVLTRMLLSKGQSDVTGI